MSQKHGVDITAGFQHFIQIEQRQVIDLRVAGGKEDHGGLAEAFGLRYLMPLPPTTVSGEEVAIEGTPDLPEMCGNIPLIDGETIFFGKVYKIRTMKSL